MTQYNLTKLDKKLRKELDYDRYRHTVGVMFTSAALAMRYGYDLNHAQTAGLLHDCAKCIPNEKKLKLCDKYGLEVTETEKKAPYLLHAKLGSYLAKEKFGVDDPQILGAIRWHTTGKPAMTLLEKIVFMADYIEPMRQKAEILPVVREAAFQDLDHAVYLTLRDTLRYLGKGGAAREVDEMTEKAFQYYEMVMAEKENDDE